MFLSSNYNEDTGGGEKPSGIKRIAHFFLSTPKKQSLEEPIKLSTEKASLTLSLLAGKERVGLIWMNAGENHLILSSAFGHHLSTRLSLKRKIRIVSFKTSYGCWERMRSYFPSLPRFLPLNDSSGPVCYSLSPEVEFVHISEGGNSGERERFQQGAVYLVSLSGREEFLESAFFQQVDQIIFIIPPDRAGLTQLYQALKWVSLKAPWLPTRILLDGTGFSCSDAWDFLREYQGLVRRFLDRSLDFCGLCDSEGILKGNVSAGALEKNIYFSTQEVIKG